MARYWVLLLLLGLGVGAGADSFYTPDCALARIFSDRKAIAIGDVIHILVTESASAAQNMQDTTASTAAAQVGPGGGKLNFLPLWSYSGDVQAQAKGATTRSDTLTARLAVTVVGLAPNGNLLVEGERRMTVHKDYQVLKISGEVRPRDIAADNTVPSYKVANVTVSYTGSSPSRPGGKCGLLTRALHWLF